MNAKNFLFVDQDDDLKFGGNSIVSQKYLEREYLIISALKKENKNCFVRVNSMNRFLCSNFRDFKFFSKSRQEKIYLISDEKQMPLDFYKCHSSKIKSHKNAYMPSQDESGNQDHLLMKLCKTLPFQNYDEYSGGLLLYGPAGSGKTSFARELRMVMPQNFVYIPISSIISSQIGQSEKAIERIFAVSKMTRVIFIDEIDVLISLNSPFCIFTTLIYEIFQILDRARSHGASCFLIAATNLLPRIPREFFQLGRLPFIYHFTKNKTSFT